MHTTATAIPDRPAPSSRATGQRPHRSAVTWWSEEYELIEALKELYGIRKDADLLRQLVIATARENGADTAAAEARLRTPLQVRREAT